MNSAELFIKALENEGVEYIFAVPGEENLAMLEAIRRSKIKLVVTRHEQGAGFMAATLGRVTGKAGVCLATLGPGATNLTTPAAYAQLGGWPLLIITGQKPIKKSKQGRFQIVDVVGMMKPLTNYSATIYDGARVAQMVREAFYWAESGRRGATHLEFPEDISEEKVAEKNAPLPVAEKGVNGLNTESLEKIVEMLAKAKRPLLLLGRACSRNLDLSAKLEALVREVGIYYLTTQMGKGAIDERNQYYLGTTALSDKDFMHEAVKQADLILCLGHDSLEKPPFLLGDNRENVFASTEIIDINEHFSAPDSVYRPDFMAVADLAATADDLREFLKLSRGNLNWDLSFFRQVRAWKENFDQEIAESSGKFPLTPREVVIATREALPEDGIVTLDNGMYKLWFTRHYPAYAPHTLLMDNALATMGAGLPSAMAMKLLFPDRKVIAVCGDGGFMMNSQEMETAVRMGLDLIVMILRDDGYGMIKWKQQSMGLKDFGLDFGNPDFVKYAESYGAGGHRLHKGENLKEKLNALTKMKGIQLLDVPIDYGENVLLTGKNLNFKI